MTIHEKAYAKINLYLNVTSKRPDGFHNIETVMQTISLCDDLAVSLTLSDKAEVYLSVGGADLPNDSGNIVTRAAELYLARSGKVGRVDITLIKRIPVAAGLAGGSADAAATLRAMNRLFNDYFSENELLSLSAELGSDVPFCLLCGCALCRGRGELIEPIASPASLHFVIAIADGEQVSTPAAYRALDDMYSDFDGSVKRETPDLTKLYNIFENAVFPTCSKAEMLKKRMIKLGATASLMSGSGPSVFGLFESEADARAVAQLLEKQDMQTFVCEFE
jgi:4-diphosphocytidyl-2-C-methyl-D-erythritol kinase